MKVLSDCLESPFDKLDLARPGQVLACLLLLTYISPGAQELAKIPQIGYLSAGCDRSPTEALQQGLRGLGYIVGKTIAIQYRNLDGKFDQLSDLAADLIRLKVYVNRRTR